MINEVVLVIWVLRKVVFTVLPILLITGVIAPVTITVAPLSVSGQTSSPLLVPDTPALVGLLDNGGDGSPLTSVKVLVTVDLLGTASFLNYYWTAYLWQVISMQSPFLINVILPCLRCNRYVLVIQNVDWVQLTRKLSDASNLEQSGSNSGAGAKGDLGGGLT